jgi:hypothetical protein
VMLDTKSEVETEIVAQAEFAPKLFISLMRRHVGLGPDMRKMRELHYGDLPSIRAIDKIEAKRGPLDNFARSWA